MKLVYNSENKSAVTFTIFNRNDCWYIKLSDDNVLGPYTSFRKAQQNTETLILLSEIKNVA